jgi:hypothetical protein
VATQYEIRSMPAFVTVGRSARMMCAYPSSRRCGVPVRSEAGKESHGPARRCARRTINDTLRARTRSRDTARSLLTRNEVGADGVEMLGEGRDDRCPGRPGRY